MTNSHDEDKQWSTQPDEDALESEHADLRFSKGENPLWIVVVGLQKADSLWLVDFRLRQTGCQSFSLSLGGSISLRGVCGDVVGETELPVEVCHAPKHRDVERCVDCGDPQGSSSPRTWSRRRASPRRNPPKSSCLTMGGTRRQGKTPVGEQASPQEGK